MTHPRMTPGAALLFVLGSFACGVAGVGADPTGEAGTQGASDVEQVMAGLDYPGADGFAALYTLGKDVPEGEQAKVLAEDVRRLNEVLADPSNGPGYEWDSALDDYPALPGKRHGKEGWCQRGQGCLALVRGDVEGTTRIVEGAAKSLQRVEALARHGHFRSPFQPHFSLPIPNYAPLFGSLTHNALRFVQGDRQAALSGTCSGVLTGRRLILGGDYLVGSMIGASLVEQNSALLAEMMAQLPAGQALPAPCEQAFSGELDARAGICRSMLSEGRMVIGSIRGQDLEHLARGEGTQGHLDVDRTAARMAPEFTWYCSSQVGQLAKMDLPVSKGPAKPPSGGQACQGNEIGCVLADTASPHYHNYAMRIQDAAAVHRLAGELVRLQESGRGGGAIPTTTWSGVRDIQVGKGEASIALFKGKDGAARWTAPLPGSWRR